MKPKFKVGDIIKIPASWNHGILTDVRVLSIHWKPFKCHDYMYVQQISGNPHSKYVEFSSLTDEFFEKEEINDSDTKN